METRDAYRRGEKDAYDLVIAIIIGLQNDTKAGVNSPEYQALQRVLVRVEKERADLK